MTPSATPDNYTTLTDVTAKTVGCKRGNVYKVLKSAGLN